LSTPLKEEGEEEGLEKKKRIMKEKETLQPSRIPIPKDPLSEPRLTGTQLKDDHNAFLETTRGVRQQL
jgi:hypothetical protein